MADITSAPSNKSYILDLLRTYFRYLAVHCMGLSLLYFSSWAVLSTSVGNSSAILYFSGCALVSVIGLIFFNYRISHSDLFLPKVHCAVAYTLVSLLAAGAAVGIVYHMMAFEAVPESARLAGEVLGLVMFGLYFLFSVMRITEARFLPDSLPGHAEVFEPLR